MRKLLFVLFILLVSGCEKVDSVCSISGGQCCALSYSTDINGNPTTPSWYGCVKDNKCPPEGQDGSNVIPTFPVTNPPQGKCEVKFKNVLMGLKSGLNEDLAVGILSSIQESAINAREPLKRDDGSLPDKNDGDYCALQCSNPDAEARGTFCQGATVDNNVSLALLRLTAEIVQTNPTGTKTIPIEQILDDFKVPRETLSTCPRSAVIINNGELINQGYDKCESELFVSNANSTLHAELITPYELRANLKKYHNIAAFNPDDGTTFELKWSGTYTQEYYGGPIVSAAQSREMDTAVGIKGKHGVRCAAIESAVTAESNLHEKTKIANSNVGMVKNFANEIKKIHFANDINEDSSHQPELLPLSTAYSELAKSNSDSLKHLSTLNYNGTSGTIKMPLTAKDMALMVDISRCGMFIEQKFGNDYMSLLPPLQEHPSQDALRERNKMAGELILCVYAKNLLSKGFNDMVVKHFGPLP